MHIWNSKQIQIKKLNWKVLDLFEYYNFSLFIWGRFEKNKENMNFKIEF